VVRTRSLTDPGEISAANIKSSYGVIREVVSTDRAGSNPARPPKGSYRNIAKASGALIGFACAFNV